MAELENNSSDETPIWAIFGDLMSALVGIFVLLLVWVLGFQLQLAQDLKLEKQQRAQEQERLIALEQALAEPLANGRITIDNGRIGISGNVLFASNSAKLQQEGQKVLQSLVKPLQIYLSQRDQVLMVSGFTDDLPIQKNNRRFNDNWELSAQRALTVTRALIDQGMPEEQVFAAAFGAQQPAVPNTSPDNRKQNRRVEIAPVPKMQSATKKP